jgi:hypothetical protein
MQASSPPVVARGWSDSVQDLSVGIGGLFVGEPEGDFVADDGDARQAAKAPEACRPNFDVEAVHQADDLRRLVDDEPRERPDAFHNPRDIAEDDAGLLDALGQHKDDAALADDEVLRMVDEDGQEDDQGGDSAAFVASTAMDRPRTQEPASAAR